MSNTNEESEKAKAKRNHKNMNITRQSYSYIRERLVRDRMGLGRECYLWASHHHHLNRQDHV